MLQQAQGEICALGNETPLKLGVLLKVFSETGFIQHV